MKIFKKKKALVLIAGIIMAGAAAAAVILTRDGMPKLEINGTGIGREEYLQAVKSVQFDVKAYFRSTYGAETGGDFWTGEYGGEIPYQKLADEAIDLLKYRHAVYDTAEEKGYIQKEDASYTSIVNRMEEENLARKEKKENGEAVYGLTEYSLDQYLDYEMSSFRESYINDPENKDMEVSEEELLSYYENGGAIVGEDGETLPLDETKAALINQIRQNRYEEMIQDRVEDSGVTADMDKLYAFTLNHI